MDVDKLVIFPPLLIFTQDGEVVELGTGVVRERVFFLPDEWCFHRTPTSKPLGTFYPSKYDIVDRINYKILKQIVKDRDVSPISNLTKGEKISRLRADLNSTYNSPEYREKHRQAVKRWWTPERRKLWGLRMIEINRQTKEKRSEALRKENNPERTNKISRALKEFYSNPINKKKNSEGILKGNKTRGETMRRHFSDPRVRRRHGEAIRRGFAWKKLSQVFEMLFVLPEEDVIELQPTDVIMDYPMIKVSGDK